MFSRPLFQVLITSFCLICLFSPPAFSQDKHPPASTVPQEEGHTYPLPDMTAPPIIELDDDRIKIGEIILDKKEKFIRIDCKINMSDGLIEYLGCSPDGKLHESVLVLNAQPYHIQIALLLLGLLPGDQPIEFQGAPQNPCGAPVRMMCSWEENGKTIEVPPEELIFNMETNKTMAPTDWVFTGSMMDNSLYMAQMEGSVIAVFHDPAAIIDHRGKDGADDRLFFANKKLLPPVGTPVILKIFPITDPAARQRTQCVQQEKK